MKLRSVNVVVLPDENTREKAIELGAILEKKFEVFYSLLDKRFMPHITLYQATYPARNYEKIKSYLKKLTKNITSLKLKLGSYNIFANTFVFWNVTNNKQLIDLHYRVIETISPLREGLLPPDIRPDGSGYLTGQVFTTEQRKAVQMYGYPVAGKLYKPHITLGKVKNTISEEILSKILPKTESEFEVSEVCIGRLGDHGTVVEILEKFPFKS